MSEQDERTDLAALKPKHLRAIRMYVGGSKKTDIASELGVATTTVARWFGYPLFKAELAREEKRVAEAWVENQTRQPGADPATDILESNARYAAATLVKLLDSDKESIRRDAATKILALTGHGEKSESPVTIINISDEQVERLERTADALGFALSLNATHTAPLPDGLTPDDVTRAQGILETASGAS